MEIFKKKQEFPFEYRGFRYRFELENKDKILIKFEDGNSTKIEISYGRPNASHFVMDLHNQVRSAVDSELRKREFREELEQIINTPSLAQIPKTNPELAFDDEHDMESGARQDAQILSEKTLLKFRDALTKKELPRSIKGIWGR